MVSFFFTFTSTLKDISLTNCAIAFVVTSDIETWKNGIQGNPAAVIRPYCTSDQTQTRQTEDQILIDYLGKLSGMALPLSLWRKQSFVKLFFFV